MASAQKSSLIDDYSRTFTTLQSGKKELIQWGVDPVILNRYIIDAAGSTNENDPQPVLRSIDLNKVVAGDSELECMEHCEAALKRLISLQEEITVLQKSARESGISAGLLTIIGQAANQSPGDNGASVLKQLSDLVAPDSEAATESALAPVSDSSNTIESQASEIAVDDVAANDFDLLEDARLTGLQKLSKMVREHWKSLLVDASASAVAACLAISLIS